MSRPIIIVFGNEKGGTGKSTTAVQVAIGLMKQGHAVATLDLDLRQGSLTRYLENRAGRNGLPLPVHTGILPSNLHHPRWSADANQTELDRALKGFTRADFIVIDTPGSDTQLSRLAHARADVLVTPLNDSFLDLDVLARIDPKTRTFLGPSVYSDMLAEIGETRAKAGARPIDWIVMRNRLGHAEARNKREMTETMTMLSERLGFRMARGFGERTVFRELFLSGLTMFDLGAAAGGPPLSMSHIAGRHEARGLIETILSGPSVAALMPPARAEAA